MVAARLSGPARASVGSVRDYVLGLQLVNGRGEELVFGGQVMKNVAGYDVSRLMVGALGTLALITEVSLKVLPVAPAEATLRFELPQAEALRKLNAWGGQPLPLNASRWQEEAARVHCTCACAAPSPRWKRLAGRWVASAWSPSRPLPTGKPAASSACPGSPPPRGATCGGCRCRRPRRCWRSTPRRWWKWHGAQRWVRAEPARPPRAPQAPAAGATPTQFRTERSRRRNDRHDPLRPPWPTIPRTTENCSSILPGSFNRRGRLYPDF
jgi:glycolate oxidase FAD binding subunit